VVLKVGESMVYTVKKLSELSGVTVRTLHYYEEISLLKPAYHGSNGYRYYEEKQLLQLQQILFFKELGFTLKQIQKVLGRSDFDQLAALFSHKQALSTEKKKIGMLIKTIDQTIKHLQGTIKMKDKEIFNGFSQITVGKGDEPYFTAEALVLKNLKNPGAKQDKALQEKTTKAGLEILNQLVDCMEKGDSPSTEEVQLLIKKHYTFAEQFHNLSKEVYKALAELYTEHPAFRKQLDSVHVDLPKFMSKAMIWFADHNLA